MSMKRERATVVPKSPFRKRIDSILRVLPAYAILSAWALFTIFVILWIVSTSFKSNRELFQSVWSLPRTLHVENYAKAWSTVKMGADFLNSLTVVAGSVAAILVLSAPVAYVLSRMKFRGNNFLTMTYTAGMGIPVPLLFIPLFVVFSRIRLINTLPGLALIYVAVSVPFTVYLLTGFYGSLPNELDEAATIDGCTDFQVFFRVMLPLSSPGLITAAIFNTIALWNEYQLALVFLSNPRSRTLSLGLYSMANSMQYTGDWVGLMAGVVIVMIPTTIAYIFLSQRMMSGITMGAVKS